ncbi:MAG: thioredoxin-disulfide reductase [Spirochaetales bacterium]|nr:thioredoxin-disulfide reductase [Spirochaetales bacterium]
MTVDWDIIIIGAGFAGLTAGQYAARANLNVVIIEELAAGGQAVLIDNLENYPGMDQPVNGYELSQRMENQAAKFGVKFETATVKSVIKEGNIFKVQTADKTFTSYAVIVASGAKHKKLGAPGEEKYSGRGVSYCATCDGPFFKDRKMLVVGGGDAACDEAMFLAKLSDKVVMVHRRERFRAQKTLAKRVLQNPNIEVRFNTEVKEIKGDDVVKSVVLMNNKDNTTTEEEMNAVFIFIGSSPNTHFLKDIKLDETGYIVTTDKMESNVIGLYAAGDVRATPFRQLTVACGEGAVAAHCASQYIDCLRGDEYI